MTISFTEFYMKEVWGPNTKEYLVVKKEDEINELLLDLCILASNFSSLLPEHEREKAVEIYRETLEKPYATGWNGTIEMQCKLPLEYMPEEYFRRNPGADRYSKNEDWLRRPKDE